MDVSDPNDIQSELLQCEKLEAAKEKKRLEKMSGFLKNGLSSNEKYPKEYDWEEVEGKDLNILG